MKIPKCILGHQNWIYRVDLTAKKALYFYECRKCGECYPPHESGKDRFVEIMGRERKRGRVSPKEYVRMV